MPTVVPGDVQPPSEQETKQEFYFEVTFYFLLTSYMELQPS